MSQEADKMHKLQSTQYFLIELSHCYEHLSYWDMSTFRRRLAKLEMLKRRGKGPPKKGQGRRAVKRSK